MESNKNKKYYEKNREKILAYQKKYRKKNREKIVGQLKKYYEKNREKLLAYKKEYYEKNQIGVKCNGDCFNCIFDDCIISNCATGKIYH